ncbi:MAG: FGGY family carbohydrate kinase [Chloroflexota bacterium]
MDPVFRFAWWQKYQPDVIKQTEYFFGWIDFLTFRMTGRPIMDHSTASRYAVYDLAQKGWDQERLRELGFPQTLLPQTQPWGSVVGEVTPTVAADWGLPPGVVVAQGCHDLNCAAYGAGVFEVGTVCLVSGSYENILAITERPPTEAMLLKGLSVMPQPGRAGLSVIAVHPTGNAVLNWARNLTGAGIDEIEVALSDRKAPGSVLAVPYLSGSMAYWDDGRKARGGLLGLTLATSNVDVVQAFMESISYDSVNTLSLMQQEGSPSNEFVSWVEVHVPLGGLN